MSNTSKKNRFTFPQASRFKNLINSKECNYSLIGPGSYENKLDNKINRIQDRTNCRKHSKISKSAEKYDDPLKYKRVIPGPGNYDLRMGVF